MKCKIKNLSPTIKQFCLIFTVLAVVSCSTTKKFNPLNEELSIKTVLHTQQIAWNTGNIDAFMLGYWNSPELSFIGKRGVTRGWQKTSDNYKKSYPDQATMGLLEFDIIELKVLSPSAAYMIGKYTMTRAEDEPSGYFNLLWEKINGKWVIISDHTSG